MPPRLHSNGRFFFSPSSRPAQPMAGIFKSPPPTPPGLPLVHRSRGGLPAPTSLVVALKENVFPILLSLQMQRTQLIHQVPWQNVLHQTVACGLIFLGGPRGRIRQRMPRRDPGLDSGPGPALAPAPNDLQRVEQRAPELVPCVAISWARLRSWQQWSANTWRPVACCLSARQRGAFLRKGRVRAVTECACTVHKWTFSFPGFS